MRQVLVVQNRYKTGKRGMIYLYEGMRYKYEGMIRGMRQVSGV